MKRETWIGLLTAATLAMGAAATAEGMDNDAGMKSEPCGGAKSAKHAKGMMDRGMQHSKATIHKSMEHAKGMTNSKMKSQAMPMSGGKGMGKGMMKPPFATEEDVAFAEKLWPKLHAKGFDAVQGHLYAGMPPHGAVRELSAGMIDGHLVLAKTNYGGKDLSVDNVVRNPSHYLKSITVMVKRPGYDPEDRDWFWVKYAPDGTIMKNKKGMALAGKVAKGMPIGCISCHQAAPGGDFVFAHKNPKSQIAWLGGTEGKQTLYDLVR